MQLRIVDDIIAMVGRVHHLAKIVARHDRGVTAKCEAALVELWGSQAKADTVFAAAFMEQCKAMSDGASTA